MGVYMEPVLSLINLMRLPTHPRIWQTIHHQSIVVNTDTLHQKKSYLKHPIHSATSIFQAKWKTLVFWMLCND